MSVQKTELVRYLADRTGLNEGEINLVLAELRDAVVFYNRGGRGVKLDGLGTYLPNIKLNGAFDISHRLDAFVKKALNTNGLFTGTIQNSENIGKSGDELVDMWNTDNPSDPVV